LRNSRSLKAAEPPSSPGRFVRGRDLTVAMASHCSRLWRRLAVRVRPRWAGPEIKAKDDHYG
jgi:hypothetical protein